jgi:hypothetical protein
MRFRNIISISILTLVSISLVSCSKTLNIVDYISTDKPIVISLGNNNREDSMRFFNVKTMELERSSDKFSRLATWGQSNSKKWKWTPGTFVAADIYVTLDDFHLLYYKNGSVVVDFKGKEGKYRQFSRQVSPGGIGLSIKLRTP